MSEIPPLDPEELSKVLAKTVDELSDADVDQLIAGLRAERAAFIASENTDRKKRTTSAITKAANKVDASSISFEDLGI
jgi:hypothetical protein